MKKIFVFIVLALCMVSCFKTFAQTNVSAQSVRLAAGRDTVTFSPQPNGTLLYGNGSTLSFKTGTGWKKVFISPPTGSAFWNATGGTTVTTPTITGNVTFAGQTTTNTVLATSGGTLGFTSRSLITSPSDGNLLLSNNAVSNFNALQFGGTSVSYPALSRGAVGTSLILSVATGAVGGSMLIAGTGGTTTIATNAVLDVQGTSGAFLPPRMTTAQRDAIGSPSQGMEIWNTTLGNMNHYNGSVWGEIPLMQTGAYSIDFPNTAIGTYSESAAQTLTGVNTGQGWICSCDQGTQAGLNRSAFYSVEVTGSNTIVLRYHNNYTAATDPSPVAYNVVCIKK